jgi:hypothetical protein
MEKKKNVVFDVRVVSSERKLFRIYCGSDGDLSAQQLIHTNGGASVSLAQPTVPLS